MQQIKGKVLSIGKTWLRVEIKGCEDNINYLLIDNQTKDIKEGHNFNLIVETICKEKAGTRKWFHIASVKTNKKVVIGFELDTMVVQPITGNVFVKGTRAYKILSVKKRDSGWSYGYDCEYWWECVCEDVTNSNKGLKAISEIIDW